MRNLLLPVVLMAVCFFTGCGNVAEKTASTVSIPPRNEELMDESVVTRNLELDTSDKLVYRYGDHFDSGVELERTVDGKPVWRVYSEPLMVQHSHYEHKVNVKVKRDVVHIHSKGSYGTIREKRDLETGKLLERAAGKEMVLTMSNQSFEYPIILLFISIDGAAARRYILKVGDQHNYKNVHTVIPLGKHTVSVTAEYNKRKKYQKSADFEVKKKHWLCIEFFLYNTGPEIEIDLLDEPPGID